jgi:subtilase family serine protease
LTVTQVLTDLAALADLGEPLWAIVDDKDAVAEADERNNTAYGALGLFPDLTLTAEDVQGAGPVVITVHNAGVITATDTTLVVYQGALTGAPLHHTTLNALGPGAVQTTTLSLSPDSMDLWIKVDPDNLIIESDEANNLAVRTVTIPHRIYLPLVLRQS